MPRAARIAVAALSLSAAGLVGLVASEGYTDRAVIPVRGDRPTIGFGTTYRDDGTPVQPGDRTEPVAALRRAVAHLEGDQAALRRCMDGATMTQGEWDVLVDHSYQYGPRKTCTSTVARLTREGQYTQACESYLAWHYAFGRDCRVRANDCYGVWTRAQERRARCLQAGDGVAQ
jgi:GH24 family phage-related lysozyme (muramidase)